MALNSVSTNFLDLILVEPVPKTVPKTTFLVPVFGSYPKPKKEIFGLRKRRFHKFQVLLFLYIVNEMSIETQ